MFIVAAIKYVFSFGSTKVSSSSPDFYEGTRDGNMDFEFGGEKNK